MFKSVVILLIGWFVWLCTKLLQYLQMLQMVSQSFFIRADIQRLLVRRLFFNCRLFAWASSHSLVVKLCRKARHPIWVCILTASVRWGRVKNREGSGWLLRQACSPSVMAVIDSGAALFRSSHNFKVFIATSHWAVTPLAEHWRIWVVVSLGKEHPGHLAEQACLRQKRAEFVPKNPLFHLITFLRCFGLMDLKAALRLGQFTCDLTSEGIVILLCQWCREGRRVRRLYKDLSRIEWRRSLSPFSSW